MLKENKTENTSTSNPPTQPKNEENANDNNMPVQNSDEGPKWGNSPTHHTLSKYAGYNIGLDSIDLPYGTRGDFIGDSIDVDFDGTCETVVEVNRGTWGVEGRVYPSEFPRDGNYVTFNSTIDNTALKVLEKHASTPDTYDKQFLTRLIRQAPG